MPRRVSLGAATLMAACIAARPLTSLDRLPAVVRADLM